MNGRNFELDLLTQQFIVHRWHTSVGRELRERVVTTIKEGGNVKDLLEPYILEHPTNVESYEYPYYPPDAMDAQNFWVLANDDLRGIRFYDEDFSDSTSLAKMNFSYGLFSRCNLTNVSFELTDLSCVDFERCIINGGIFAYVNSIRTRFVGSQMHESIFLDSHFVRTNFSGSDLTGCYFEGTELRHIKVDYLTKFDKRLRTKWHQHSMPMHQLPDLYHSIRLAYERAELNATTDHYLLMERSSHRRYVLWYRFSKSATLRNAWAWTQDWFWAVIGGYGTKPARTLLAGAVVSFVYTLLYYCFGAPVDPNGHPASFLSALYFSFTTFATLGYGDLTYAGDRPYMRLLSTSEAWLGAVLIAFFVVVVARKIIRR